MKRQLSKKKNAKKKSHTQPEKNEANRPNRECLRPICLVFMLVVLECAPHKSAYLINIFMWMVLACAKAKTIQHSHSAQRKKTAYGRLIPKSRLCTKHILSLKKKKIVLYIHEWKRKKFEKWHRAEHRSECALVLLILLLCAFFCGLHFPQLKMEFDWVKYLKINVNCVHLRCWQFSFWPQPDWPHYCNHKLQKTGDIYFECNGWSIVLETIAFYVNISLNK